MPTEPGAEVIILIDRLVSLVQTVQFDELFDCSFVWAVAVRWVAKWLIVPPRGGCVFLPHNNEQRHSSTLLPPSCCPRSRTPPP